MKNSLYKWYIIDIVIFIAINFWTFKSLGLSSNILQTFTVFELFIFGLGVWRLTDILTQEAVTEWVRAPFKNDKGEDKTEGIKGFFASLFSCNACFGVWMAMLMFYAYILWPHATGAFILVMALTGFERFFSKVYNFLEKRG